jgi:cyclopropane fatty-acyl-phospholipid synthase-like methyltransferase
LENKKSNHYDSKYYDWQKGMGAFGGWANITKFNDYISPNDDVLDFGCGGGYLLKNLVCKKRVGVEINHFAALDAKKKRYRSFF